MSAYITLMKRMKLADNDDFLLMIAGTGED